MANAFAQLGRAVDIDTAMVGFALGADDVSIAHRTTFRHVKVTMAARLVFQHLHNFGDDVPAALHRYPVADAHAQAVDLVHVVQGGAADGGAADRDRL